MHLQHQHYTNTLHIHRNSLLTAGGLRCGLRKLKKNFKKNISFVFKLSAVLQHKLSSPFFCFCGVHAAERKTLMKTAESTLHFLFLQRRTNKIKHTNSTSLKKNFKKDAYSRIMQLPLHWGQQRLHEKISIIIQISI